MANLRIDDTRRVAPGQAPGQFAAPDASGGAQFAARQLQQAGQAITQAGTAATSIYIAEMEKLNESRVTDALNRAQTTALELQGEYTPMVGEAAIRAGEDGRSIDQVYPERFDQAVGDIQRDMGLTSVQAEAFRNRVAPVGQNFRRGVTSHVLTQRNAYTDEVETTTLALNEQLILGNPSDEQITGPAREAITNTVTSRRRRLGLPIEGDELAAKTVMGKAYLDAITATEDEDFEGAQQLFDRYRDYMTAEQQNAAQNTLATGIAYNEAEAYVAAAREGVAPPPGQPGSEFQHPAPGAAVSSGFGTRTHPITGATKMHGGTDFAAPLGSPARGMLGGRVIDVSYDEANGNIVRVDHGNGLIGSYAHLQGADVREGQEITAGQNIGRVGSTGQSTGPHLHVTMRRNGELVDPETLIGESAQQAEGQAAAGRPTRAQMEADARARFGNNRLQRQAALSEIARVFGEEDRATREAEENAIDAAYRHIEQTNTMPTPRMMALLPPGRANGMQNYLDARLAPAVVRSDPDLLQALTVDTSWQELTSEEFIAKYGSQLSQPDRLSYLGALTRANASLREEVATAAFVKQDAFSGAWAMTLDVAGIDRTPSGARADENRQGLAMLNAALRAEVLEVQALTGKQLGREEIAAIMENRLGRLAWERPENRVAGITVQSYGTGYQTSYRTMIGPNQETYRRAATARLRRQGENRNPTEDEIFNEYLTSRFSGN